MLKVTAIISIASISFILGSQPIQATNSLCMNDRELIAFLIEQQAFLFGKQVGVCIRKYKNTETAIMPKFRKIVASSDAYMGQVHQLAVTPFVRTYGKSGEKELDALLETTTRKDIISFVEADCNSIISAVDGLSELKDGLAVLLTGRAKVMGGVYRDKIPSCY